MPIKTSADKLKRELEQFGFPPQFPVAQATPELTPEREEPVIKDKSKSKKVTFEQVFRAELYE